MNKVGIIAHKMLAVPLAKRLHGTYNTGLIKPAEVRHLKKKDLKDSKLLYLCELPELLQCNCFLANELYEKEIPFATIGFEMSPYHIIFRERYDARFTVTENTSVESLKNNLNTFFTGKSHERVFRRTNFGLHNSRVSLGPVQYEVLYWVCHDLTTKEIAELTGKSVCTIEKVRLRLMNEVEVSGTAGLVKWAYDNRVVYPIIGNKMRPDWLK